jgi:hypothetical protein
VIKRERELLTWMILIIISVTAVFGAVTLRDMFGFSPAAEMQGPSEPVVTEPVVTTATLSSPGRLSGAIFTTDPAGTIVNENVWYENKSEVYLDGGSPPNAPVTSAGLPEGLYVFQITDPSGKYLLSQDPSKCRIIKISTDGVIVELVKPSDLEDYGLPGYTDSYSVTEIAKGAKGKGPKNHETVYPCHIQDEPDGIAGPSERHDTNNDTDHGDDFDAIVVQMMPFLDTPNPGGVYKAWVTPLYEYLNDHSGDLNHTPSKILKKRGKDQGFAADPGFGPPRGDVKTDNFKVLEEDVEEPPVIKVLKFHDLNANGVWDMDEPDEPQIGVDQCVNETTGEIITCPGGWPVNITEPLEPPFTSTKYTPVEMPAALEGDYIVEEWHLDNWFQSAAFLNGVPQNPLNPVTVTVPKDPEEVYEVIFGNYMLANISGLKFIDMDGDGDYDSEVDKKCSELEEGNVNIPGCSGVTIILDGINGTGGTVHEETDTDENGEYAFLNLVPGNYTITVDDPDGFLCNYPQLYPIDCEINWTLESGDSVSGPNFYFGDLSLAEIHGVKYEDLNGNGKRDEGEPGVPDVNFTLTGFDGRDRWVDLWNLTDENGEFWFMDLWPGEDYTLTEEVPEGYEPSTDRIIHLDLTSDNVTDVEFGNFIPAELHGMKYIDLNGNGTREDGEGCSEADVINYPDGCVGIIVTLQGIEGDGDIFEPLTTTTDENGEYWFMDLEPGTYNITITDPAGFVCSDPDPCKIENLVLTSDEVSVDNDFGDFIPVNISAFKFFDFDQNGTKDGNEENMDGITICLNDSEGNPVTHDLDDNKISDDGCLETNISINDGVVEWNNLAPGNYTLYVDEDIPGICGTTLLEVEVEVLSGEVSISGFGNYGPCNGLTPGYWSNWNVGQQGEENHYNEEQFTNLLVGTIAEGNITLANITLKSEGCDKEDSLHCMRRFLLANQLTLNLANYPLYSQGGGSLFGQCLIEGKEFLGTLEDAIALALAMHNNPCDPNIDSCRQEILDIKNILAGFAEQEGQDACPV